MKQNILFVLIFFTASFSGNAQKKQENKEQYKHFGDLYTKYQREGKTDSVLYIAKKFYPIAQRSGNDSLLAKSYNLLGNAYVMSSDFPSSLEYYLKFLELSQKSGDVYRTAIAYENTSYAYYLVGNYTKGAAYGKEAVDLFLAHPELKNKKKGKAASDYYLNLANATDNWALNLMKQNQPQKSLDLMLKAISYVDKADYKDGLFFRSGFLADIGNLYAQLQNPEKAEAYFQKSIELNKKWNITSVVSTTNKYYANFLLGKNKIPEAISIAKTGLDAAIATKEKIKIIELSEVLQKSYDKENRIDSAYYYSKLMNVYRDSVFSSQKMMDVQNLTFKRENQEREMEIEKEKLKEERKHNLQYAAIAVGLIGFLILYLIFSHSVKANKRTIQFLGALSMLLVFEFLNLLLHPYIGEITHHQPFFMLLFLAGIASVLIPLHHKLEHWITHKLVEKNQEIRLAKEQDKQ